MAVLKRTFLSVRSLATSQKPTGKGRILVSGKRVTKLGRRAKFVSSVRRKDALQRIPEDKMGRRKKMELDLPR